MSVWLFVAYSISMLMSGATFGYQVGLNWARKLYEGKHDKCLLMDRDRYK